MTRMTRETLLTRLGRAFGVHASAVSWAAVDGEPVAMVGRLLFRLAGARVAVWTGRAWVPVRDLAELSEVLADAGALHRSPTLDRP